MTEPALLLAPLTCAAVLLLSGVAKYGDADATRDGFVAMRVPTLLTRTSVVRALPIVEIALGFLLLASWGWLLAGVATAVTVLFAVYWVLVLRVLLRGEEVDCGCFGAAGDDRVTGATLARNTLLVALAAVAAGFGAAGSGVLPSLGDLGSSDVAWLLMAVAVAATAVLVMGARTRRDEPVPDEELLDYERKPIPFGLLRDRDDHTTTLRQLAAEKPQLLLILSSTCAACRDVAAKVPGWLPRLGPVEVQTVFTDPLEHLPPEVTPAGVAAWYDVESGVTQELAVGRPSAVLLGADGLLAGGPVSGATAITEFVEDIVAELARGEAESVEPVATDSGHLAPAHEHGHGHDDGHDHGHGPEHAHHPADHA